MPYTLYKTNGIKLTTVEDGTLNITTDLQFVGKNYSGYGQAVNQNLVNLLENFASTSSPSNPLAGQIWYDSSNKKIKYYTGTKWNQVSTTNLDTVRPTDLSNGEFWFDSSNNKLYIKKGDSFVLIGPSVTTSGGGTSGGTIGTSTILADTTIEYDVIPLTIGDTTEAVISTANFNVDITDDLFAQFTKIKNGITLQGADPITGVSTDFGSYFWGTAADALRLDGHNASEYLLTENINLITNDITALGHITFISSGGPAESGTIEGAWQLTAGSTLEATYADLAEKYMPDAEYEPGTVLIFDGSQEVTMSTGAEDHRVAGIVSTNPAYKLNSDLQGGVYIALVGRVPCKVVGTIRKGDMLVTSGTPGVATASIRRPYLMGTVIGKALQSYNSPEVGVIEVKVL
jgi:hypothetical protein